MLKSAPMIMTLGLIFICAAPSFAGDVASRPEDVKPLATGASAPDALLLTAEGTSQSLSALYSTSPTLLIFYRGGWCPYCTQHLAAIGKHQGELRQAGVQIVAISPEKPQFLPETAEKHAINYRLLGDPDADAIKAFGLAFRLDDETYQKYQGYGIQLEQRAGATHHILPVPAAYLIDREGRIRYAFSDPDYKNRVDATILLAEVKKLNSETKPAQTR